MILSYITMLVLVIVLGLIIGFLYIRDKETSQILQMLKGEILELKEKNSITSDNSSKDTSSYKELDNKIYEIGESLIKIVRNLKNIDSKQKLHEEKLSQIEEQLKLFNLTSSSNSNENKIISLFKDGKTIEEIASEERIPVGEVELIVKLANLNVN